jgi:nucleotide-binding universal stress UspA family protein
MLITALIVAYTIKLSNDGRFSKVLVAIDGSTESMAAVDRAIRIAKNDNAELIAFNAVQLPVVGYYNPGVLNSELDKGTTEADNWFTDIARRTQEAAGAKVKTQMVRSFGSPSSEIVGYAEKENVDLIVMGTRGRGKMKKMLLGSTASGVVMNASCTVMVVR